MKINWIENESIFQTNRTIVAAPDIVKIFLFTFLKDMRLGHWPTDWFWWKIKKINPVIITSGVLGAVIVLEAWNVFLSRSVSINIMTIRILRWLMLQFLRYACCVVQANKQTDKQKAILKLDSHTHTPSILVHYFIVVLHGVQYICTRKVEVHSKHKPFCLEHVGRYIYLRHFYFLICFCFCFCFLLFSST